MREYNERISHSKLYKRKVKIKSREERKIERKKKHVLNMARNKKIISFSFLLHYQSIIISATYIYNAIGKKFKSITSFI